MNFPINNRNLGFLHNKHEGFYEDLEIENFM